MNGNTTGLGPFRTAPLREDDSAEIEAFRRAMHPRLRDLSRQDWAWLIFYGVPWLPALLCRWLLPDLVCLGVGLAWMLFPLGLAIARTAKSVRRPKPEVRVRVAPQPDATPDEVPASPVDEGSCGELGARGVLH